MKTFNTLSVYAGIGLMSTAAFIALFMAICAIFGTNPEPFLPFTFLLVPIFGYAFYSGEQSAIKARNNK